MSDLIDLWNPTSRGKVKCSVCLTIIPRGERYERQKRVDAGRIWEVKTCQLCEKVVEEADRFSPDDELTQQDIYCWAIDEAEDGKNRDLARKYLHRLETGERE